MVTSNSEFEFLFFQGWPLLSRRECFAHDYLAVGGWNVDVLGYEIKRAILKSFRYWRVEFNDVEANRCRFPFVWQLLIPLEHRRCILPLVDFCGVYEFPVNIISSRICLLIRPISVFDGLINLQVGLFAKLSLWSFSVINASFVAIDSHELQLHAERTTNFKGT